MRLTDGTPRARITLAADLIALGGFILAGMGSHRGTAYVEIFLRNAVPIGGSWLVTALVARTYRPPSLVVLILTWAVAVPAGVALRTWWTGSWDRFVPFVLVAGAFTLLFLLVGRAVATLVDNRRTRERIV